GGGGQGGAAPGRRKNDERAAKPRHDREPAAAADPLGEEDRGHDGDEERSDEEDRVRLREGEAAEPVGKGREARDAEPAAQQVQARADAEELPEAALHRGEEDRDRQRRHPPDRRDLHDGVVRGEDLEARIHQREGAHPHDHDGRGAQVLARGRLRRAGYRATTPESVTSPYRVAAARSLIAAAIARTRPASLAPLASCSTAVASRVSA